MRLAFPFMPMATQRGPVPLGMLTVELRVIEPALVVTCTLSIEPDSVACTMGGSGFVPISYFSMSFLISFRRHSHCDFALMRVPSFIANGSGRRVFFAIVPADTVHFAPVFSG